MEVKAKIGMEVVGEDQDGVQTGKIIAMTKEFCIVYDEDEGGNGKEFCYLWHEITQVKQLIAPTKPTV